MSRVQALLTCILAAAGMLFSVMPSYAQYDEAFDLYKARAWKQALPKLQAAAEQGNLQACFYLAECYDYGQGLKSFQIKEALEWYTFAAKQGHAESLNRLGECYEAGRGVKPNMELAIALYKEAAKRGSAAACLNLGSYYSNTDEVESMSMYLKAFEIYQADAEEGDVEAQAGLGGCYFWGYGTDRNFDEAFKWYQKAADAGDLGAKYSLSFCYSGGFGVKQNKGKSKKMDKEVAELGYPQAQDMQAQYTFYKDWDLAIKWCKKAAIQGYAHSFYRLGGLYEDASMWGKGKANDKENELAAYKAAAALGHADAQKKLQEKFGITTFYDESQPALITLNDLKTLDQLQQKPQNKNFANAPVDNTPKQPAVSNAAPSSMGGTSVVDSNIPTASTVSENTFAVIIGNENYKQVAKVDYALNDATVFAEYCRKTLGIPETNVKFYPDATFGDMKKALYQIKNIAEAFEGNINVIFYYAGHGVPDESSKNAQLLPIDADGTIPALCLPLNELYSELAALNANNTIVFMDACFSGAQRGEGMLAAARGVALKAKADEPKGNLVVFSAATGEQTAYPFEKQGHGMFTYYILKKLQDSKGDVTLGDLADFVSTSVRRQSVVVNDKPQIPTISSSPTLGGNWKTWKLK